MTRNAGKGMGSEGSKGDQKRVSTTFTEEELEKIDNWGFSLRIRDRSEAIRQLVKKGLSAGSTS